MKKSAFLKPGLIAISVLGFLVATESVAVTYQIHRETQQNPSPDQIRIFWDFNETGTAVGSSFNTSTSQEGPAFRWSDSDLNPLDLLSPDLGQDRTRALHINNAGVTVGTTYPFVNNVSKGSRAVRWNANDISASYLEPLNTRSDGFTSSDVFAINDDGVVIGFSNLYGNTDPLICTSALKGQRAVRWEADSTAPTNLGVLGTDGCGAGSSFANAINKAGVIVGSSNAYLATVRLGRRAVRWDVGSTSPTNLGTLGAGTVLSPAGDSIALFITDDGVIAGNSELNDLLGLKGPRAVRWGAGDTSPTNLGTLGISNGFGESQVFRMNNTGIIIGYSRLYANDVDKGLRAVRWNLNDTAPINLGTLGTYEDNSTFSFPGSIDDNGNIVGQSSYYNANNEYLGTHAVIWDLNNQIQDLNSLLSVADQADGWLLTAAREINNNGQILAEGTRQGIQYTVVLEPDSDNDGVLDASDNCPLTPPQTVVDPSNGCPMIKVPSLVGQTQADAQAALVAAGLVADITITTSSTVPSGSVISQNPAADTSVANGSSVNLVVSSGPAMVSVPSVIGQTQANAQAALATVGLATNVSTASSNSVPAGSIISQDPAAGVSVATGSSVNLVVSSGAAQTVVGDVNGDGVVTCTDVRIVTASLGKRRGQAGYDARADINNNGVVDLRDLAIVSRQLSPRALLGCIFR